MGPGSAELHDCRRAVLAALAAHPSGAMTTTELAAKVHAWSTDVVDDAVLGLLRDGQVVVVDHAPFERHLEGFDLRTIAAVRDDQNSATQEATQRAEQRWNALVLEFVANHRCT